MTVTVISISALALLLIRYQSRALASIATTHLSFSLLQWSASVLEQEVIQYQGMIYRIAASSPHNFQMLDDDILRFEVRRGDRYRSASWTDEEGIERSEMGETSNHKLTGEGSHFHATYKMMIEPGAKNTAQWLVTGQLFTGGTPPFEIKFMGNDKMAVVIKYGTSSSPVEKTIYLDTADIQRGKWYDMEVDVQLDAAGSNGHAYVWRDGAKIANYTGKIGYTNATESHWEMGAYRKSPTGGESFAVNYKDIDLTYGSAGHSDGN
ncbi:heparin lyase I family protein [Microvirga lotononidis]|uniref:Alginate lyase n=1 Tax=Microvirga lotononidis TaxID=864069 RepID=I4YY95_9HYPH|nr:heparin lyase I family protein [Microvirga lotononidis]EIM28937.1 Alginate lyase [Microvirga lotononidis]WQO26855.1 heparin lyase I family protein [Microvirga lotononidis]